MKKPMICNRYSETRPFDEESKVPLRVGMCITGRVDENKEVIGDIRTLPYAHYVHVVIEILEDSIRLVDTGHNNEWKISYEELDGCELVAEFHYNVDEVDCEYINRALTRN